MAFASGSEMANAHIGMNHGVTANGSSKYAIGAKVIPMTMCNVIENRIGAFIRSVSVLTLLCITPSKMDAKRKMPTYTIHWSIKLPRKKTPYN